MQIPATAEIVCSPRIGNPFAFYANLMRDDKERGKSDVRQTLINFIRDETAATAIEYGLIAAGIAVAIIAVTKGLGSKLNITFTSIQAALK
jgi:pilus assembly protein Flp/PilA